MKQRHIEVFQAVMASGGISRAAEALNVSQPAVSRTISDFERLVGFPLFDRSGGRAIPTPEAVDLNTEIERFYVGLERVEAAAAEIRDLRRGHVRFAAMPAVAFSLAPRIVGRYVTDNPTVKVTMDVHTSPRIADQVAARHFDLGMAQLPELRPDIDVVATWRVLCVCALPLGHPLAGADKLTPRDLKNEAMIALSHHTLASRHLAQSFLSADVQPSIRVESQPSYAACAMAAEGIGIAIVDALTADFFGKDRISVVPFLPETPFDIRLMRPADFAHSRVSGEFTEAAMAFVDSHNLAQRIT